MDFNETIQLDQRVLKTLKDLYIKEIGLDEADENDEKLKDKRNVIKLINTIAAKKGWFDICPQKTSRFSIN
jgi:hypothetical protein